jgi:hypothetical protein
VWVLSDANSCSTSKKYLSACARNIMSNVDVKFVLSPHEKMIVQLRNQADVLNVHYEAYFYFLYYNRRFMLCYDFIDSGITELQGLLIKAVNKRLLLDSMYYNKTGVYWNYSVNKENSEDLFDKHYNILKQYAVFQGVYVAFIYNDEQGNIILEITPSYPFTHPFKKHIRTYGYFLRWMSRYKTTYRTIISEDVAHAWIAQAQDILDVIEKNTARLYGY